MARSTAQIAEALKTTLRDYNPTLDLEVGPLNDYLLAPLAPQLAVTEAETERLLRYYSPNFASAASPTEARNFANNFGSGPSGGEYARGRVIFYRNSTPAAGTTYTISVGDMISTKDSTLLYRVTQATSILGAYGPTYFNPSTNRYEVEVEVEAISPGSKYNIPTGRITRMLKVIEGMDGVEQRSAMAGGTEPENIIDTVLRVQGKFQGLDKNSVSGLIATAKALNPTNILDAKVIRPTDRLEFRRFTDSPALDLVISGSIYETFNETYIVPAGSPTQSVPITENRTAVGVDSVTVNGVLVTPGDSWVFQPDTSLDLRLSTRASPRIQFAYDLNPADTVVLTGTRNSLLDQVQTAYTDTTDMLFRTDILVRSFVPLPIQTNIEVRISGGDPDTIRSVIDQTLYSIIEPPQVPEQIIPEVTRELLAGLVPEITAIKITKFRRTEKGIAEVEIIQPLKNEIPRYDSLNSFITVRL